MQLRRRPFASVLALALAIAPALSLGGCASVGDSFASTAFVDPAKYELFDCKRLETERASLVAQATAKQALIDKAATGAGGTVIGEVVYRNDYIALRAQKKSADAAWERNGCDAVTPPPVAPVAAQPAAAPPVVTAAPKSRGAPPPSAPASSAARAIY